LTLHPADLRKGDLVYQLEVDWPAETLRVSDVEHDAPFGDGAADVQFHGVMELGEAIEREIDLFSVSRSPRSVSPTLDLQDVIDVPATVEAQGGPLLSPARLYVYPLGATKRTLIMRGSVQAFTYDVAGEPLVLEIEQSADDDEGSLLRPTQFIGTNALGPDGATWEWDGDAAGEFYPVVIGKPGSGDGSAFGSPAFGCNLVSPSTGLMIAAAHRVAATSVYAENFGNGASGTRSIVETYTDQIGSPFSLINVVGWASPTWNDGDETWIDWGASAGGLEFDGELLRGAGDVIRWALTKSTLEWDSGRLGAVTAELNKYLIDATITAEPGEIVRPWEWLTDAVLPLLPVSIVYGPEGLYPALWRTDATAADAILSLEEGANCTRLSDVGGSDASTVKNDFTISYGFDAKRNRPTRRFRLCGDLAAVDEDADASAGLLCRRSFARFGQRAKTVRAEAVWDAGTAGRIARWMAAAFAMPSRAIEYQVDADLLYLEAGDVVAITDSALSMSSRVALVERVALDSLRPRVALRLYEQP